MCVHFSDLVPACTNSVLHIPQKEHDSLMILVWGEGRGDAILLRHGPRDSRYVTVCKEVPIISWRLLKDNDNTKVPSIFYECQGACATLWEAATIMEWDIILCYSRNGRNVAPSDKHILVKRSFIHVRIFPNAHATQSP